MRAMRSDANERQSSTPSNNAAADPRCSQPRLLCHCFALVKAVSIHKLVLFYFNLQRSNRMRSEASGGSRSIASTCRTLFLKLFESLAN